MVRRWLRHILAKSSKVFTYLVVSTNWALGAVACKLSTTREKNENKCLYPECIQGFYIENVDSERLDTQSGDKQRYDTITMSRETVESPDEIWRADVAANSVHPWLTGSLQRGLFQLACRPHSDWRARDESWCSARATTASSFVQSQGGIVKLAPAHRTVCHSSNNQNKLTCNKK